MKQTYLYTNDSDKVNACKIVELVKAYEREKGLTDEEIVVKYTQGYCSDLADAIRMSFGYCFNKEIETLMLFENETVDGLTHSHSYARIGDLYVDIFGAHTLEEAREFVNSGALHDKSAKESFEANREKFDHGETLAFVCLGAVEAKEGTFSK